MIGKRIYEKSRQQKQQVPERKNKRNIQIQKWCKSQSTNILQKQTLFRGREGNVIPGQTRQGYYLSNESASKS